MRPLFLIFTIFLSLSLSAQNVQLSEKAEIRVLTCGPDIDELYSAFGHSAIRVYDPERRIDLIYNYGVFDFDQPNFYLNFAKGFLYYKLAVQEYRKFKYAYIYYNRFIHEQRLDLTQEQKQKVFEFLQWNARPENMHYRYDYFYDNCATRIRDAFATALGDQLVYDLDYVEGGMTIRELTDIYLTPYPWGDLGIDLGLGLPMDRVADSWMYMFLPDYIEQAFGAAKIYHGDTLKPLVTKNIVTYASVPEDEGPTLLYTPAFIFWSLFAIVLTFTVWQWRSGRSSRNSKWLDAVLFSFTGLLGWALLLLWLATDHQAAARNMNILWAFPLNFPVALWLLKQSQPQWVRYYFGFIAVLLLIILIFWLFLPQHLHFSLIPVCLMLAVRAMFIFLTSNKKQNLSVRTVAG